jgi:hypothetical protein
MILKREPYSLTRADSGSKLSSKYDLPKSNLSGGIPSIMVASGFNFFRGVVILNPQHDV